MNKIALILLLIWYSCNTNTIFAYTRQDTLRGSNGPGRSWWDVQSYNTMIRFETSTKSITGEAKIRFLVTNNSTDSLQLDLQEPMVLDSIWIEAAQSHSAAGFTLHLGKLQYARDGNVYWLNIPAGKDNLLPNREYVLTAYYHGTPHIAKRPPWDGGFIWTKDSTSKPWIAVACQGFGASSWWPCKDYQGDEPDQGATLNFVTDSGLTTLSNGILTDRLYYVNPTNNKKYEQSTWQVANPINTYNETFYIGDYVSWTDTLMGEKGKLNLSFYALRYNEEKARKQFAVTKDMLHCFEYWMGPYPFYEDGYKLVEAPYLGMEHQSAVAYGNKYLMGYMGMDRSGTGVGMLFDFIIVHESGHEWFGNNITVADIADNWIHEGFTTYIEALFAECAFGKQKAYDYTRGQWKGIKNDTPVIGDYGVNSEGSGDMYDKGSAIVHMIRTIINDDEKFRQLLRGLNRDFYHKITTSAVIEKYISDFCGYDFAPLFNQYLRTTLIPAFDYYIKKKKLYYRFKDVVEGFSLPLQISADGKKEMVHPTSEWQSVQWDGGYNVELSKDFLIKR